MDGNTTYNYNYDPDQEPTAVTHGSNPVVTDYAYEYDSNGQGKSGRQTRRNLGTGSDYDLVYDAAGQLRKILTHGTTTVLYTYAYDGHGRRYSRKVGSSAAVTTLHELGLLRDEIASGNESAHFGYGLNLFRRNGEFAVWDGQGDLRNSLSVDGNYVASVVSVSTYDAFRNRVAYDNSTGHGTYIPNQYCGLYAYRKDGDNPSTQTTSTGDAGLMHVGARWYDAAIGRFASTDADLTQHPYAYCDGDPVNYGDPDGSKGILQSLKDLYEVAKDVKDWADGGLSGMAKNYAKYLYEGYESAMRMAKTIVARLSKPLSETGGNLGEHHAYQGWETGKSEPGSAHMYLGGGHDPYDLSGLR